MARGHSKGVVGGAGQLARTGLFALAKQDSKERNQRLADEEKAAREADHQARLRRIALVAAIGRLNFKRGTAIVEVATDDRKEGLELLCRQQGWTITYRGHKAIVQQVVTVRTVGQPPRAA